MTTQEKHKAAKAYERAEQELELLSGSGKVATSYSAKGTHTALPALKPAVHQPEQPDESPAEYVSMIFHDIRNAMREIQDNILRPIASVPLTKTKAISCGQAIQATHRLNFILECLDEFERRAPKPDERTVQDLNTSPERVQNAREIERVAGAIQDADMMLDEHPEKVDGSYWQHLAKAAIGARSPKRESGERLTIDLAMLCKRLAFRLGRGERKQADKDACKRAMEFLARNNLLGSVLRNRTEAEQPAQQPAPVVEVERHLKKAIGGLRSIAYGHAQTWPNCSSREVAKQALQDCGGEKHPLEQPQEGTEYHGETEAKEQYAASAQADKADGLTEDLQQFIRVVLTNPGDIRGFVRANYPKEYAEQAPQLTADSGLVRLLKEADRLLEWAANEFEQREVSADNWRGDYQLYIEDRTVLDKATRSKTGV